MDVLRYRRWNAPIGEAAESLLAIYAAVFDTIEPGYLLERLPRLEDPDLWIAETPIAWVGFKLAYRRGPDLLYSWLGGVLPEWRGRGIAAELAVRQHAHARARGYGRVETSVRASNAAMIRVNLRQGFSIVGRETDARGIEKIVQRKPLD